MLICHRLHSYLVLHTQETNNLLAYIVIHTIPEYKSEASKPGIMCPSMKHQAPNDLLVYSGIDPIPE